MISPLLQSQPVHVRLHDSVPPCYTLAELIAYMDDCIEWNIFEFHANPDMMDAGKYGNAANRLKHERAQLIAGNTNNEKA